MTSEFLFRLLLGYLQSCTGPMKPISTISPNGLDYNILNFEVKEGNLYGLNY